MSLTQITTNPEFQDASPLYSSGPPLYVGNFVLAREPATSTPICLNEIYEPTIDALQADPGKAKAFAQRYGKLSVSVALDNATSSFNLELPNEYPKPGTAPIRTTDRFFPSEFFKAADRDTAYTYLLCDDIAMTGELALIQALHMLDYALVSDQFDAVMPQVKAASLDQLIELQALSPTAFIRTYGNVRELDGAPQILGTVVPTSLLEKSGLEVKDLGTTTTPGNLRAVPQPIERERASAIGITTAKRPHIGHGFLLVKALAETGESGNVIIELNDKGPRIAAAVSALALKLNCSVEQAIDDIVHAEISPSTLEAAYRMRRESPEISLPSDFALTANNAFYSRLLDRLRPQSNKFIPIADSSQTMQQLTEQLLANPSAKGLFGKTSMVLLGKENSTVVRQYNEPTMVGIIGALASGYELTMVDSPSPLDKVAQRSFLEADIPVQLEEGIGISFDFGVASGTTGEAPLLQSIIELLPREQSTKTLQLLRAMLNEAVFVRGDGKSFNPNFANPQALQQKLQALIASDFLETDIFRPFKFRNITRDVSRSLTPYEYVDLPTKGKITSAEINALLTTLPAIRTRLSDRIVLFAKSQEKSVSVPKNIVQQSDTNLVNKLRSGEPKTIFSIAKDSFELQPELVEGVSQTQLNNIMVSMGYKQDEISEVLAKLIQRGDIYALD